MWRSRFLFSCLLDSVFATENIRLFVLNFFKSFVFLVFLLLDFISISFLLVEVYCFDVTETESCVDKAKEYCAGESSCKGFAVHQTLCRVHFKSIDVANDGCTQQADLSYNWVEIVSRPSGASSTNWLETAAATHDLDDYSHPSKLIFEGYNFPSGGTYKVCACDSAHVFGSSSHKFCKKSDFKIEVGTIHVSGVSCLVEQAKFQRGICIQQFDDKGPTREYYH